MGKIYVLKDPLTEEIMYVGKTTKDLIDRLLGHINDITRSRIRKDKQEWIKSLLLQGYCPIILLVEEVLEKDLAEKELYWIKFYQEKFNLLNIIHNNDEEFSKFKTTIKTKKVYQYSISGKFIKEWDSLTQAAKILNLDASNICNSATKCRKTTGEYQWRYFKKDLIPEHKVLNFKKEVHKYDLIGNYIKSFISAREADNISFKLISKCCKGDLKSVHGYRYSFIKYDKLEPLKRKIRIDKKLKI
jgi:hypothetical protein